jgi:hypothetical protein
MSKSLIRKNQLHPDIGDLVTGYGLSIFVRSGDFEQLSQNLSDIIALNTSITVLTTGNQNISGLKDFKIRPTVNNTGVLLQGEETKLPNGILYTTGAQTIESFKNFTVRPTVNNTGVLLQGEEITLPNTLLYSTGAQSINGPKEFLIRPTLNGIGFATTGDISTDITFNGNRSITRTTINGVIPQGNDVVSFLNNLFYPFTQAVIDLNSFNTVYELGTTLSTVNCQGSITLNSLNLNQLTNLQAFVGNNGVLQIVQPSTSFNFTANVNLTNTANITARANSINQNNQAIQIVSNVRTINFAAPWYYGAGAANLTPAQIQSLFTGPLRKVELPSNKTITITANNQKIYFAYPQSWGVLTSIKDENNFENLNGWLNRPNLSFTLANGSSHTYTVRETSLFNTFTEPFSYTFIF